ncbi:MAG: pyridoxamine 5'-phosphate oxidase family protein [Campylobacteraceae bacterium]
MDFRAEFLNIMKNEKNIALATQKGEGTNVRIVNFYYDASKKVLYFLTFKDNDKVREIEKNSKVSFTTIPTKETKHARVNVATAKKSVLKVSDLKDIVLSKNPENEDILAFSEQMYVFEVAFDKALVVLSHECAGEINI